MPHTPHTPRKPRGRRLAVLTASAALAAAGALLPSTAFAAPATQHATTVTAVSPAHDGQGKDRGDRRIGYCHWHSFGSDHGKRHAQNLGWGWWHCHHDKHGHRDGKGHDNDRRHDNDRWRDADLWRDAYRWHNYNRVHGT